MGAGRSGLHAFTRSLQSPAVDLIFGGNNREVRRFVVMGASAAAVAALALAQGGAASLGSLGNFFFGPKLVRAEVITSDGGVV